MLSSSSSRNFLSHAIPYISAEKKIDDKTDTLPDLHPSLVDLPSAVVMCTSCSFMNGSLAPEVLQFFHQPSFSAIDENYDQYSIGSNWGFYFQLFKLLVTFSNTIQFGNSLAIESSFGVTTRHTSPKELLRKTESLLKNLVDRSRYFLRQCESFQLNLTYPSPNIFQKCLPKMIALRRLILGPRWNCAIGGGEIHKAVTEAQLVTALTAARNLDTLEINYYYSNGVKKGTLEKIWSVNEMKHLRSFQFCASVVMPMTNQYSLPFLAATTDLRCISDFHSKKLTSLTIVYTCPMLDTPLKLTPPNLASMTELRRFECDLHSTDAFDEDHFFNELFLPVAVSSSSSSPAAASSSSHDNNTHQHDDNGHHLKYLTNLKLHFDSVEAKHLRTFFTNRLDGALLRELSLSLWVAETQFLDDEGDAGLELITSRFPLLETLDFTALFDTRSLKTESFELIAKNLVNLKKLILPHHCSGDVKDEGVAFLFDPEKCTGGIYATLEELAFGADEDDDDDACEMTGLNWFGSGLGNPENNYRLRVLDLGCRAFKVEGFLQMCTAFAHCLESLTVSMNMEPMESSMQLMKMPVMTNLTCLRLREVFEQDKEELAALIVKRCPKLNKIKLITSEDGQKQCCPALLKAVVENFIEDEGKFLTIEFLIVRENLHESPALAAFEGFDTKKDDDGKNLLETKLAGLKSLRCIRCSKSMSWSHLKKLRPDIKFSHVRPA